MAANDQSEVDIHSVAEPVDIGPSRGTTQRRTAKPADGGNRHALITWVVAILLLVSVVYFWILPHWHPPAHLRVEFGTNNTSAK